MLRLLLACLACLSAGATAQPAIEEIVVSGELRNTDIDQLPASIAIISNAAIERRGARHLDEVVALAPNVNLASGGSRSRFFQIRGIGERGQFAEPLNPSVGVLLDGTDVSNAATVATLFDIEQIEIFRGPQGTRYGANALAGMINVKTRAPTDQFEAELGIDQANYDAVSLLGVVSGPLTETVSGRVAIQHHSDDGFVENSFLGANTNKRDELSLRAKLRWQPTDELLIDTTIGLVDLDNGYDAFSLDNDRSTLSDQPGRDAQKTQFGAIQASWDSPRAFNVEASLSSALSDNTYGYDEDWTFAGFHPFGYSSTDYYLRDRATLTSEFRLLSTEQGKLFHDSTHWAVGAYALNSSEDLTRNYTYLSGPFSSTFDIERRAMFGQLDADISHRVRLSAGVRVERHRSTYRDSENVVFDPSDSLVGWRLAIDYDLRDGLLGYALLARGYKAGGFNTNGSLDEDLRRFEPETTKNIEVGLKGYVANDRLGFRLAVFHMQRNDIQIASSTTRVRSNGSTEFIEFIGNQAKGSNAGVEAELDYSMTENLSLTASVGLLRTQYKSFVNSRGDDLSGREQAHAPRYQFALSATHQISNQWYWQATVEGRDKFYFSSSHNAQSRSYSLLNATIGYTQGPWSLTLWARNLTDEETYTRGYFFGNDPRIDYAERGYTQLGEPRRAGVSVSRIW